MATFAGLAVLIQRCIKSAHARLWELTPSVPLPIITVGEFSGMSGSSKKASSDATPVEQAVARAVRDNLDKLQRTSSELHEAGADMVAACASSKPINALPPMLPAQTAPAPPAAAVEVVAPVHFTAPSSAQRT